MKKYIWWGLVAIVCCAILGGPVAAEYVKHFVQRCESSDYAELRDESVTTDDPATIAGLTTITAITVGRKLWVYTEIRFNGSSDSCIVTPRFYDASGDSQGIGDAVTISATSNTEDSLYQSEKTRWETEGATYCKFRITTVSGTVEEVWGGTR